jgi:hypothetical protein
MKRRGRYARFTGATAKYVVRIDRGKFDANGKAVEIPVGPISLSKAVMSTGQGPSSERMAEYYSRVTPDSFLQDIPKTIGLSDGMREVMAAYERNVAAMKVHRIVLTDNAFGKLELVFTVKEWIFIDVDYRKQVMRRSRTYGSKAFAMGRLQNKMVTWIEELSLRKTT